MLKLHNIFENLLQNCHFNINIGAFINITWLWTWTGTEFESWEFIFLIFNLVANTENILAFFIFLVETYANIIGGLVSNYLSTTLIEQ